jgi:hypothetical protein
MSQTKGPSPRSAALEHADRDTRHEAEQCLAKAGSPDQAQRAVDSATGHPAKPTTSNDAFATRYGFASYLEIFEASKPLALVDGKNWFATHAGEQWIVWNDEDLEIVQTVKTLDEAHQYIGDSRSKPFETNAPTVG